jgi:hypothetical protein
MHRICNSYGRTAECYPSWRRDAHLAFIQERMICLLITIPYRSVTQGELDDSITAQLFPLQQQIYALRKSALENLILRTILEDEAKRRNISVEELRKQFTAAKPEVPQSQVEQGEIN